MDYKPAVLSCDDRPFHHRSDVIYVDPYMVAHKVLGINVFNASPEHERSPPYRHGLVQHHPRQAEHHTTKWHIKKQDSCNTLYGINKFHIVV